MSRETNNFIIVPAPEVRRRGQQAVDWYDSGGREKIKANKIAEQRAELHKTWEQGRTGWPWARRPLTEAEIERKVDYDMNSREWGNGTFFVDMYMFRFDERVSQIRSLIVAATGDNQMVVDAFIWRMIVSHSTEADDAVA
jgi:hypothetical protein